MNARRRFVIFIRPLLAMALLIGLLHGSIRPAHAATQTDIHGPEGSERFGTSVTVLPNGNFVVTDPYHDHVGAADTGAVFLYDGASGGLISTLAGSTPNDRVGSGGVTVLSNGNYVVSSPLWDNGGVVDAGAASWGSGTAGLSGEVSDANSLVGATPHDQAGLGGVIALSNGNYVVNSPRWDDSGVEDAGAVTWGDGSMGVIGEITIANSLVGATPFDQTGSAGVCALSNGNYVVSSHLWDNGGVEDAGAVTWGDGYLGAAGPITPDNSLVGSTADDWVGNAGVAPLGNGNYVVRSPSWDNGGLTDAGAVTWGYGNGGVAGEVSPSNSLVGGAAHDRIGSTDVIPLSNDNYVVNSGIWDNGAATDAGAVTWGDGYAGVSGEVSPANSLVGGADDDRVGFGGVVPLSNGNYVVISNVWSNGPVTGVGAVTWGDGSSGTSGEVSPANSLVGSLSGDQVGYGGVTPLTNGNYVALSPEWDHGGVTDAGAVTWGDGGGGTSGEVLPSNSLVGSQPDDTVGYEVTALSNGNYVVTSPFWDNDGAADAGAATWADGASSLAGEISAANSLVGGEAGDRIGQSGTAALTNGHYVVSSPYWKNGSVTQAGAVTWGNGVEGTTGPVSAANSLVGSRANNYIGYNGVTALTNGDYVVLSPNWSSDGASNAGAVTWGNGAGGTTGPVTAANSLVGENIDDMVGLLGVTPLSDGSYIVFSPGWDHAGTGDAGAITWSFGPTSVTGPVTTSNSVYGTAANGGYVINYGHDPVNHQLVVGRPADNIVTLFRLAYGVSVTPATAAGSGLPGATVSYTLQVTNTGDMTDRFSLAASGNGWNTNLPVATGLLAAGASQNVTVSVIVPASITPGSTDTVTIHATSQGDGATKDISDLTTTASIVYGLTVTPATAAKSGLPRATVNYTLAVKNTGNTAASFKLTTSGHAWATTIPAAVGPLASGASQNVTVGVTVPASAMAGSKDVVTVTVTSQADPTKTDTAVLTTTAGSCKIYMPVMRQ